MVSASVVGDPKNEFCRERAELATVLSSRSFQRAPKLSRILAYICERYFEGTASELKEYSIAIDALGRAPGFDPQADAIVRVDLHLLRKRLESYYAEEGRTHEMRIVLPIGQYTSEFVLNHAPVSCSGTNLPGDKISDLIAASEGTEEPLHSELLQTSTGEEDPSKTGVTPRVTSRRYLLRSSRWLGRRAVLAALVCGLIGLMAGVEIALAVRHRSISALWILADVPQSVNAMSGEILRHFSFAGAPDTLDKGIRIRCGSDKSYADTAGFQWQADRYFTGGKTFRREMVSVFRSNDAPLYSNGRRGTFHYDVPVSPGLHEVHLLFAETEPGVLDGMRPISYTIGAGDTDTVDVVADAGGPAIATMKIYPNVRPGSDGKIHINFWSDGAFLNALEILPQHGSKPGPMRVSALSSLYIDVAGRRWLPDRFFMGGRNVNHRFSLNRVDPPLFSRERYGNFNYAIPVAAGHSYQLTLYMAERYWGPGNSGQGGIGSRIFNVRCNGIELLHGFDLLKEEGGAEAVAVRFRHLRPDAGNKLNIEFVPITNYSVLDALEVEPE